MKLSLKGVGKFIDRVTPDISIAGHKFAPFRPGAIGTPAGRAATASMQANDPKQAAAESYKAGLRTSAAGLALGLGSGAGILGVGTTGVSPVGAGAGAATQSGGGVPGWIGRNWDKIIPVGLGVWNAVEGNKADKRAQGLEEEALRQANLRWQEMAPLRSQAMAGLRSAQRPDLSSLTYDEGNPYSRSRRIPRVGSGA